MLEPHGLGQDGKSSFGGSEWIPSILRCWLLWEEWMDLWNGRWRMHAFTCRMVHCRSAHELLARQR
jgi:hypothetical protein